MGTPREHTDLHGQLSPAGIAIGCAGCVVITASSVYTALKMSSLPWPTIFTSILALVLLRALGRGRGRAGLNEANVTQVVMSAGSMVAGGLAFTVPGIWMLGLADSVSWTQLLLVALAGTLLGLACTALIRRRMIDESDLEYPIGAAAARTLEAATDRSGTGRRLFASMAAGGLYALLRDAAGILPQMLLSLPVPGVSFGIYNSPMMLCVGYLMGGSSVALLIVGAVVANLGVVAAAPALGWLDQGTASELVQSLGMGLMMGSGLGVVAKDVLPAFLRRARSRIAAGDTGGRASGTPAFGDLSRRDAGLLGLLVAAAALALCLGLGLAPVAAAAVVALTYVTTIMSAQSVGSTGIDPMEVFGLIVLLFVAAISDTAPVRLFFAAGVVAVACGLAGDVMSDFKTGALIGTSPRAMWAGQAIGALLGCVVATATLAALFGAYGPDAFGLDKTFPSGQASVVATMVGGIPNVPAFAAGLAAGIALYVAGLPSMMLGLGVYLPFYMSLTMFAGALVKAAYTRACKALGKDAELSEETGTVVSSGLLGGESVAGVAIALASVVAGLAG